MLNDLFGFYKRAIGKMSNKQIEKELNQIKLIERMLQQKLKEVS